MKIDQDIIDQYKTVGAASYNAQSEDTKVAMSIILNALAHAEGKHPDPWAINTKSKVYDHNYAASIVIEEAGELTQAAMQHEHEGKDRYEEMITEAAQTAATCIRFIKNTINNRLKENA